MKRPANDQWLELCAELEETAQRLRRDGPHLLRRANQDTRRDGFPSSTLGGGGGSSGWGDPVQRIALANIDRAESADELSKCVNRMVSHGLDALRAARQADVARAEALGDKPKPPGEAAGCIICWRYDVTKPVHKAKRCSACYGYSRRHPGEDRPEQLILGEVGHRSHGERGDIRRAA